jgi:hypothetical protein
MKFSEMRLPYGNIVITWDVIKLNITERECF